MTPSNDSPAPTVREMATEALRYWEPHRLIYNAALALIVIGHFFAGWPASKSTISFNGILGLFLLAVLANVAYCAAYVADIFIQLSGFRVMWSRFRWVLLVIGIAFASVITHFFAMSFFPHAT